jgi:hypothetical protein
MDMNRIIGAIRAKYKSPRDVVIALGLDPSLLNDAVGFGRDSIALDARRRLGRDLVEVEEPSSEDPDAGERQEGVVDSRRRARDAEVEPRRWASEEPPAAYREASVRPQFREPPISESAPVEEGSRGFAEMKVTGEPDRKAGSALVAEDDPDELQMLREFDVNSVGDSDDDEDERRVEEEDRKHWGASYDERHKEVYGLLTKDGRFSHDEAMEYLRDYGLGKMPKSGMHDNPGGRLAKQPLRTNGIDRNGQGLEGIREAAAAHAGGPSMRSNVDNAPSLMRHGREVPADEHRREFRQDVLERTVGDQMMSMPSRGYASSQLRMASDSAAAADFARRFPEAARLRRDGSSWNR